jgi:hypothetical protein
MAKLTCGTCGYYSVRTTRKWLAAGQPLCPDGEPLELRGSHGGSPGRNEPLTLSAT